MSEQQKSIDSYGIKDLGWDRVPFDIGNKKMEDLISLSGKKAIVTGAGGVGLGLCIAHRLASLGAEVMMTDINPRVYETAREVAEKWGAKTYPLISPILSHFMTKTVSARVWTISKQPLANAAYPAVRAISL